MSGSSRSGSPPKKTKPRFRCEPEAPSRKLDPQLRHLPRHGARPRAEEVRSALPAGTRVRAVAVAAAQVAAVGDHQLEGADLRRTWPRRRGARGRRARAIEHARLAKLGEHRGEVAAAITAGQLAEGASVRRGERLHDVVDDRAHLVERHRGDVEEHVAAEPLEGVDLGERRASGEIERHGNHRRRRAASRTKMLAPRSDGASADATSVLRTVPRPRPSGGWTDDKFRRGTGQQLGQAGFPRGAKREVRRGGPVTRAGDWLRAALLAHLERAAVAAARRARDAALIGRQAARDATRARRGARRRHRLRLCRTAVRGERAQLERGAAHVREVVALGEPAGVTRTDVAAQRRPGESAAARRQDAVRDRRGARADRDLGFPGVPGGASCARARRPRSPPGPPRWRLRSARPARRPPRPLRCCRSRWSSPA